LPERPLCALPSHGQLISPHIDFAAPLHEYPPGAVLFREASEVRHVFALEEGTVKLFRFDADRTRILGLRAHGSLLGGTAAVRGQLHDCTAEAITRCQARSIAVTQFRESLAADGPFGRWVLDAIADEAHEQLLTSSTFAASRPRDRLIRLLWLLAREHSKRLEDGALRIQLPLTRQELADAIAVTREHMSRLIAQLEKEDVIHRAHGWIVLATGRRERPRRS
jgi:CRP-like cAMP-binding protein